MGRDQSNISRELRRNKGLKGYRHKLANNFAQDCHKTKERGLKLTEDVTIIMEEYLQEDWSPEQIAGRLRREHVIDLHHETIYQYILTNKKAGGDLYQHPRHQNKTYRKCYGNARNRTGIPNRVDIDERPESANNRERVGDWEADTIIGKNHKGAIVTLDDRKSKLRLAFTFTG
ncbi:Mobile element protein [uncultured Candidatus Thioglobus sp.]|nr:Mobile element protein [uncultured Candidatus Thioglobus sp.]